MRSMRSVFAVAAIVSIAFLAWAPTSNAGIPASDATTAVDMPKTDFIEHAGAGNLAEIAMGQLAAQRAQSPEVKAFAQQMVDDHTKANQELQRLAAKLQVTLPTKMDAKQQQEYARLATLSGPEFDREYMRMQLRGHDEMVAIFEAQTVHGKDRDVKAWASKTLPTLHSHKEHATQVAQAVGTDRRVSNERGTTFDQTTTSIY